MKRFIMIMGMLFLIGCLAPPLAFSAYHHAGEKDAPNFQEAYPALVNTKLDSCALCHTGGAVGKKTYGSCQYCHATYGYDASGDILATLNAYGKAYLDQGRTALALKAIEALDSDGDTYSNLAELQAGRYPGDASDDPTKVPAPFRVYTKAQLAAMPQHTQFMLMNTTRQVDFYVQYTGVPMKALLEDAGINLTTAPTATNILVYAPDGFSYYHPLNYVTDAEGQYNYHVYGNWSGQDYQYPAASYYYKSDADTALNLATGWCDYSAASCIGRNHGDPIYVDGGLKAILALKRDGVALDTGVLGADNKLNGEGPFRVVVPQKVPNYPDQASTSATQPEEWFYEATWDHNAGACSRTATIIKVEPLPEGTTDINTMEAGWAYVDQNKIVVYGNIDASDSNLNGVYDSEEGTGEADYDSDGTPDYQDVDTAKPRHAKGIENLLLHTSKGAFADVSCLGDDDPLISQTGKPSDAIPYGVTQFKVTGLNAGESITLTVVFPDEVPTNAKFYKVTSAGWKVLAFNSNDGDETITVKLTDGDAATDADGVADGIITDPFAVVLTGVSPEEIDGEDQTTKSASDDDSDSRCFISTADASQGANARLILALGLFGLACCMRGFLKD